MNIQFSSIRCWRRHGRTGTGRRADAILFPAGLRATLFFLLLSSAVGRAQSTNAPGHLDYQAFKIITERNIFDPNRSSPSGGRKESRRPTRVESFALVGTLSYQKGSFAFFDGSGPSYRQALKCGDTIAGYKIAEISADRVRLAGTRQQLELGVGMQMKKEDEGEWQMAGRTESFAGSLPATAADDKTVSAGGGEESDVLKKLMQKREQELK